LPSVLPLSHQPIASVPLFTLAIVSPMFKAVSA
jgi:hypothetical protein